MEVVKNALISIPEEMGTVLKRTSFSSNIKERMDASCALFDPRGRMVAQAEHIPVHLGSIQISVDFMLDRLKYELEDGDQVVCNDPYQGGTHLPDVTILKPVFNKKKPAGFVVNRAHHSDIGGLAPGSMPGISTDIFQEGLRLPPCKIMVRNSENNELLKLFGNNTRNPRERIGDLRAQFAANVVGAARLLELIEKYGFDSYNRFIDDLLEYSKRRTEKAIGLIPRGTYTAIEYLDDDGISDSPVPLKIKIVVKKNSIDFDFSGSAPESGGNLNAPLSVTTACVYYAVRCMTDPGIPPNHGCFIPLKIKVPPASILNPREGAAVSAGNVETSQRVVDLIFKAMIKALPHKLGGQSQGTMNNLIVGGKKENGDEFTYYETIGGGEGALPYRNGQDGIQVHMTNTANTPIEALESNYPMIVEKYEFVEGSQGKGKYRGGMGLRRAIRINVDDAVLSIQSERRKFAPCGASGGGPGKCGKNYIIRNNKRINLKGKTISRLKKNDIVIIETPGGGGFGRENKRQKSSK